MNEGDEEENHIKGVVLKDEDFSLQSYGDIPSKKRQWPLA